MGSILSDPNPTHCHPYSKIVLLAGLTTPLSPSLSMRRSPPVPSHKADKEKWRCIFRKLLQMMNRSWSMILKASSNDESIVINDLKSFSKQRIDHDRWFWKLLQTMNRSWSTILKASPNDESIVIDNMKSSLQIMNRSWLTIQKVSPNNDYAPLQWNDLQSYSGSMKQSTTMFLYGGTIALQT